MIIVGMLVDSWGSLGATPEEEYDEIESFLKKIMPGVPFAFKRDMLPDNALNEKVDLYILDYGAAGVYGAEGFLHDFCRTLLKVAEEKPNTVILLWSHFTAIGYSNMISNELGKECGYDICNMPTHFPNIWVMASFEQRETLAERLSVWYTDC